MVKYINQELSRRRYVPINERVQEQGLIFLNVIVC